MVPARSQTRSSHHAPPPPARRAIGVGRSRRRPHGPARVRRTSLPTPRYAGVGPFPFRAARDITGAVQSPPHADAWPATTSGWVGLGASRTVRRVFGRLHSRLSTTPAHRRGESGLARAAPTGARLAGLRSYGVWTARALRPPTPRDTGVGPFRSVLPARSQARCRHHATPAPVRRTIGVGLAWRGRWLEEGAKWVVARRVCDLAGITRRERADAGEEQWRRAATHSPPPPHCTNHPSGTR